MIVLIFLLICIGLVLCDDSLIVVPVDGGVVSVALNASISSVTNFTATLVGANETAGVSFTLTVVLSSDAFQFVPIVLDSVPSNVSTRFTNAGVGSQAEPRNPQRMSVWSLSPTSNMTASFTIDTTGNRPRVQGLLLSASTIVPLVAPVSFSKDSELSTVFNVSYGERRFFRLQTQPADQTGRFFAVDQCSQPPKANSSAKAAVLKAGWTSFDPDMQGSGDVVFVGAASDYPSIYVSPVRAQRPGTPGFSLDGEALIAVDSSPVDYSGFIPFPQTPDPVGTIAVDLRTIADGFWTVGAASSPLVPFVDGDDLKFVLNVPNLESPLRNASQFRLFTTCDDSSLFESRTSFMMQSRCFLESNKDTLMFTSANKSGAVFEWQINSRDGSSFLVVRNFAPRCPNLSQTVFGTYASIQLTLMFGDAIVWQPVELPTWRANPNQRDDGDGADVLPLWAWIAIAAGGAVLAFLIGFIAGKFRSSRTAQYTQIK
jgi:hypothetical protein